MRACRFCLQEVPYKPLKEMEEHGIDVHFCDTCNAEYLYWKDKEDHWASWSLYVTIGDRMYRWTYSSAETAQLWWIQEPGEPGTRINHKLKPVYHCGFKNALESTPIPDITPQNAVEKIKLIIMFS